MYVLNKDCLLDSRLREIARGLYMSDNVSALTAYAYTQTLIKTQSKKFWSMLSLSVNIYQKYTMPSKNDGKRLSS